MELLTLAAAATKLVLDPYVLLVMVCSAAFGLVVGAIKA